MNDVRLKSAVPTEGQSIRLHWSDGLEGVVDFSYLLDIGGFKALRDPDLFRSVKVTEDCGTIYWLDKNGLELDICPDVLRAKLDPERAAWIEEQQRDWDARSAAE